MKATTAYMDAGSSAVCAPGPISPSRSGSGLRAPRSRCRGRCCAGRSSETRASLREQAWQCRTDSGISYASIVREGVAVGAALRLHTELLRPSTLVPLLPSPSYGFSHRGH